MAVLTAKPKVAVKNIVVATDFSPVSELALLHAIAIARHYGSKINLVHALEPVAPGHSHAGAMWGRETEAEAERKLRWEAEKCGDLECAQWVLKGTALEVVDRILSFDQIDLVIVGTHGAKGFRKVALGAAAEHLFRHVQCPVLAVGPGVRACQPVWEPKHVLLATDLQSKELTATRISVLLAREHDARLALLHVAPPSPAPFPDEEHLMSRSYFQTRLKELLSYKAYLEHPAEFLVEFGEDTVAEILRVAREHATDLIVLSVHREEPWGLHLVHEAYRIVAEAPCPVLMTQRTE